MLYLPYSDHSSNTIFSESPSFKISIFISFTIIKELDILINSKGKSSLVENRNILHIIFFKKNHLEKFFKKKKKKEKEKKKEGKGMTGRGK